MRTLAINTYATHECMYVCMYVCIYMIKRRGSQRLKHKSVNESSRRKKKVEYKVVEENIKGFESKEHI